MLPRNARSIDMADERRRKKKSRYMSKWECSLQNKDISASTRSMNLEHLFGSPSGKRNLECGVNSRGYSGQNVSSLASAGVTKPSSSSTTPFYTFRLEHRRGGVMARHVGEERILLFRSDRPGAIAKIIYSSVISTAGGDGCQPMAQAKVHVLEVKERYRGYDFGGLLFSEAMASLCHRYMDCEIKSSVRCDLDAEEDTRRHNRLVNFYERLGCYVKPMAKFQFINNNDGETYRKVPMQIAFRVENSENSSSNETNGKSNSNKNSIHVSSGHIEEKTSRMEYMTVSSLIGQGGFLPLQLYESLGEGRLADFDCLIKDDGEGFIEIHTTKGRRLKVDSFGRCSDHDGFANNTEMSCKFLFFRVSDTNQNVLSGDDNVEEEGACSCTLEEARCQELWLIQSMSTTPQQQGKTFLAWDSTNRCLQCSHTPGFWQADCNRFRLTWTKDTPPRRQHYRKFWATQTVEYVRSMRNKFLEFSLAKMTLKEAVDAVKAKPGFPFRLEDNARRLSLRTRCFQTAEAARAEGHPDWVQLIALIHAIAGVVNYIDVTTEIASENDYDWTVPTRSRVVGCSAPPDTTFSEFRLLNQDEQDERYNSSQGMYTPNCGLENGLLLWTGPEYMYHMLKYNNVVIPKEGLDTLRYFSLQDWHSRDCYSGLANDDEMDIKPFVADFDMLCQRAKHEMLLHQMEMTDEECDHLWSHHYSGIASKYLAGGTLCW